MKFCMKCMSQYSDDYNICPMCGFEEGTLPTDSRCMEPGIVLADRYIVGMPVSIDGWMVRYIGWDALTNRKVTINEYHPARYAVREPGNVQLNIIKQKPFYRFMSVLLKRAQLLSETHIPDNIVNVCECFEKNNTAYVITDHAEGKPLSEHLKESTKLRYDHAEKLMLPMLRSIDKLHDNGFIFGGFSPDSFILSDENELIMNNYIGNMFFNMADNDDSAKMGENIAFFPPERYGDSDTVDISPENDVFSAAMIMYALMGAKLPDGNERVKVYEKKHKDILKKPSAYGFKNDKSKENALINASAIEPSLRTSDMETFIKELSGGRKVELKSKQNSGLPLWAKITIPAASVLLVLGIAAAIFIPKMMSGNVEEVNEEVTETMSVGQTIVPSIINYDVSSAADELKKAGLLLEIEGRNVDDEKQENLIISQSVEKGSIVEENTVVGVVVNVHSGEFTLPNFLGIDIKSCTDVMENIGLNYAITSQYNENISIGCVVSQSVTPYTKVKAGQRVDIVISQGAEPKPEQESGKEEYNEPVREYVGQSYENATTPAQSNNFPVEVAERVYDDTKPEGTVVQQYPSAGTVQSTEEPVKVVVTTANNIIVVPDVKMLNKEAAERMIDYCGLKAEFTSSESDSVAEGLIISQSPEAGVNAKANDTVNIVISKGRPKVRMPDVEGKKYDEALKLIKDAGICGKTVYDTDKTKTDGIVLKQSISAGSEIAVGTKVLITVNSGSSVVTVPDIIGLTVEEADKKAEQAGLNLLIYVDDDHPYKEGRVSAQGPHAGLTAEKGSDLVVLLMNEKEESSQAPEKPDITISPESVTLQKGETFKLDIKTKGIDDLYKVEYDISDISVIEAIHIDKKTLAMTFIGKSAGSAEIKINCDDIVRTCRVTVEGKAESSAKAGIQSETADITIAPENVSIKKGETFVLNIKTKGIDDLYSVEYDISDVNIVEVVHIDKETLDMTYIGKNAGTAEIKISCGSIERICKVNVS